MPEPKRPLKVFLSYASQDKPVVRELSQRLASEGWIDPWVDEKKLLPGQDWRTKIEEAVETSDAVIICLSNNSVTKEGFVQKELRYAREISFEKPDNTIFLIPLRLDECEVPRGLRFFQWVDFFGENKNKSYKALVESLNLRYEQKLKLEEMERVQREKERLEREAAEKVEREKAERETLERTARERLEREAWEKALRERLERKTAERLAQEKAKRDEIERAKREKAERRAVRVAALRSNFSKSIPFLRIAGFIGIVIMLFGVGSWVISQFPPLRPIVIPSITSSPTVTMVLSKTLVSVTKTLEPSPTETKTLTPTSKPVETISIPVRAGTAVPVGNVAISINNVANLKLLAQLPKGQIADLAWSIDNNYLAVATSVGVYVENILVPEKSIYLETSSPANSVTFAPNGLWVACGDRNGNIYLWDFPGGELVYKLEKKHDQGINDLIFSNDSSRMVTVGNDFVINFWSTSDGNLVDTWGGFFGWINTIAFLPDETQINTLHANGQMRRWSVSSGSILNVVAEKNPLGTFSFDDTLIALGFADGSVKILKSKDWSLILGFPKNSRPVSSITFSSDNSMLAVSYGYDQSNITSRKLELKVWDAINGNNLYYTSELISPITNLTFSYDQNFLASSSLDGIVQIWGIFPQ